MPRGVVARIVTGPHDANRLDPHRPTRHDTGRPSSVIRLRISQPRTTSLGCVATFKRRQERDWSSRAGSVSCSHLEQPVDELNLSPNIRTAHPPRLSLPDHVQGLVSLDSSQRRLKLAKPLLGFHASFDRSMSPLHDVVQALGNWPVAATVSQDSCLVRPRNCHPSPPAGETGLDTNKRSALGHVNGHG